MPKKAHAMSLLSGVSAYLAIAQRHGGRPRAFRFRHEMLMFIAGVTLAGCGRPQPAPVLHPRPQPVVETGAPQTLSPGQGFPFADHFKGGRAPDSLPRSSDGSHRLVLDHARHPVVCVPAPYTLKQEFYLRAPATLRLAYGFAPESWNKQGRGVRFTVRLRAGGRLTTLLSRDLKQWQGEDLPNWSPISLPIPLPADGKVELELATEPLGEPREGAAGDFVEAYALWLDPVLTCPPATPRPNIVLVVVDALRADRLGCYGYDRDTTPFLDSLAAKGAVFEDASSQATWTLPSFHSLLTSSYRFLRDSRVGTPVAGEESQGVQLVSMPTSLQGELRKAGYHTSACVGGGFLDPALGFDAGFDWYWSADHTPMLPDQLTAAKDHLSAAAYQPFFLLLHTYEVHNYFQGWGHSLERFDRGYLGPLTSPARLSDAALHGDPAKLSAADLQYIGDLYDGEIHHTDRYLRLFLDWLLQQPWAEDTVFILTADHGEALGGHGVMSHGGAPYREVVQVPLLIYHSDGRWRGRRIARPVALVDLMPTLLELAGAPTPRGLTGRSLSPLLEGKPSEARPIFCESRGAATMAREGRWWYIGRRGDKPDELYDVAKDPRQLHNLAGLAPTQLSMMRRTLAGLSMQGARGYRLAVSGPRPQPVVVEIESEGPLSYLDVPTATVGDRIEVVRPTQSSPPPRGGEAPPRAQPHAVRVQLSPGDDPHVILFDFDRSDGKAAVTVSARVGDTTASPNLFHLGRRGVSPDRLPFEVRAAARAVLIADDPPAPTRSDTLGLWLWLPSTAAQPSPPPAPLGEIPQELQDQLKSLGYLR